MCCVHRADLKSDLIKPVTKATVGQLYCAYFLEDKQWHRARVVAMVSTSHVSYYTSTRISLSTFHTIKQYIMLTILPIKSHTSHIDNNSSLSITILHLCFMIYFGTKVTPIYNMSKIVT